MNIQNHPAVPKKTGIKASLPRTFWKIDKSNLIFIPDEHLIKTQIAVGRIRSLLKTSIPSMLFQVMIPIETPAAAPTAPYKGISMAHAVTLTTKAKTCPVNVSFS